MILEILSTTLSIFGALIILLCAIGFLKSKDVFLSVKLVFIANIYGFSILLIGLYLQTPTIALAIKTFILIALNTIITAIVNHLIVKKAAIEKKLLSNEAIGKINQTNL